MPDKETSMRKRQSDREGCQDLRVNFMKLKLME